MDVIIPEEVHLRAKNINLIKRLSEKPTANILWKG